MTSPNSSTSSTSTQQQPQASGESDRLQQLRNRKQHAERLMKQVLVKSSPQMTKKSEADLTTNDTTTTPTQAQHAAKSSSGGEALAPNNNVNHNHKHDKTTTTELPSSDDDHQLYRKALRDLSQERLRRKRATRNLLRLARHLSTQDYQRHMATSSSSSELWQQTVDELHATKQQLHVLQGQQALGTAWKKPPQDSHGMADLCELLLQKLGQMQQQQPSSGEAPLTTQPPQAPSTPSSLLPPLQIVPTSRSVGSSPSESSPLSMVSSSSLRQQLLDRDATIVGLQQALAEPDDSSDDDEWKKVLKRNASWQRKFWQTASELGIRTQQLQVAESELERRKEAIGRLQEEKLGLQAQLMEHQQPPNESSSSPESSKDWEHRWKEENERAQELSQQLEFWQTEAQRAETKVMEREEELLQQIKTLQQQQQQQQESSSPPTPPSPTKLWSRPESPESPDPLQIDPVQYWKDHWQRERDRANVFSQQLETMHEARQRAVDQHWQNQLDERQAIWDHERRILRAQLRASSPPGEIGGEVSSIGSDLTTLAQLEQFQRDNQKVLAQLKLMERKLAERQAAQQGDGENTAKGPAQEPTVETKDASYAPSKDKGTGDKPKEDVLKAQRSQIKKLETELHEERTTVLCLRAEMSAAAGALDILRDKLQEQHAEHCADLVDRHNKESHDLRLQIASQRQRIDELEAPDTEQKE